MVVNDGQRVTYHYRSHKSERVERETVEVYTFIGRMIQHVLPKSFQRIRSDGVQATKTFAKLKGVIQEALAKVKGIVKGAMKILAPLTYRQRYQQSTGRDPLRCPYCQHERGLWRDMAPDLWRDLRRTGSDEEREVCVARNPSRPRRRG